MSVSITVTGVVPANGAGYTTPNNPGDRTQNEIIVDCLLTLSGNYGTSTSHGDPVDFTKVNPPFSFGDQAPSFWHIVELLAAGTAPLGYIYNYCPGPTLAAPTQAGGVLQIVGTGTASQDGGNELTEAAAYSSQSPSLDKAVLKARFWFVRL
jgi:hypothetical protein